MKFPAIHHSSVFVSTVLVASMWDQFAHFFVCLLSVLITQVSISERAVSGGVILVFGTKWPLNSVPEGFLGLFRIFVSSKKKNLRLDAAVLAALWVLLGGAGSSEEKCPRIGVS